MGTSLLAKGQLQIGIGVPYHIWTLRHFRATVSASISIEHPRPHFALHDSLLQDRHVYKDSLFPSAIRLWNQLPETIVAAPTLDDFKMGLTSQNELCTDIFYPSFNLHLSITLYIQSNFDGSNSSGPPVRVRPIHVFERYLACQFSSWFHVFLSTKGAKRTWHLSLINNPLHARVKIISRMC